MNLEIIFWKILPKENNNTFNFFRHPSKIMKKPITIPIFTVMAIILVSNSVGFSAFGDTSPSIAAHTNKSSYINGEMVIVSGTIINYNFETHSDLKLSYQVSDPSENLVTLGQVTPDSKGSFSFKFLAGGSFYKESGDYSIQLSFGELENKISMIFISSGTFIQKDVSPPKILAPENIIVEAQTRDGVAKVTFNVQVIDDTDKKIRPICKPSSGYFFGIGNTVVKCTAKDSAGNFATPVSFTVTVNPPLTSIPNWVKNVASFWCEDKINDDSFVEGIQYLMNNGIIVIPPTSPSLIKSQEIPLWVKNNACWWSSGSITDGDFAYGIEFLVRQEIIRV